MKIKTLSILLLLVFFQGIVASPAIARKKKKEPQETKKTETPYERLFKNKKYETVKGLITLHKLDEKLWFELPVKLLGKDLLLGSTVTEITDNRFASVGEKPHEPVHIRFTLSDSTVSLRQVEVKYISPDQNLRERIAQSTYPAILQNFDVKAWNADSSAIVFDVTDFFLSDNKSLDPFSEASMAAFGQVWPENEFKKENSRIGRIKSFEDNVSIQSSLTYTVSLRDKQRYFLNKMPFTALMTRSIILLPEKPMRPRFADPRINIFYQGKSGFSNNAREVKPVFYANRWRLEPADEAAYRRGELVEPKQPIVFYIDDAFPALWRTYIKEGIEEWQKAFEKIGFKNAVITRDFPKNDSLFDPDNLKYSCVRYSPSWIANAMGPSWTDPRSGEILNASVYIYHNLIKLVQDWRFLQTAAADPEVRKKELDEKTIGECIRYVISHEVGHCLSLMHNMSASSSIPVDSLRSPSFTQQYGTTYSIMDYARNNYVAQPGDKERGVKLTPPRLGEYDYFTIKWLYTPLPDTRTAEEEVPILRRWISEKSGNPVYRYGKQQLRVRLDPSAVEEDLGDDAMLAGTYGIRNLKYVMQHMNEWVGGDDPDYRFRQNMYNEILYQYLRYLNNALINIGGIYLNERYDGDQLPAYAVVPREKQKRALQFILKELKDMAWLDDPQVLAGYPLQGNIAGVVEENIFRALIKQMGNVMLCASKAPAQPYTLYQYMDDIYNFVWEPTRRGKTLSTTEKRLQTNLLSSIIAFSGITREQKGNSFAFTGFIDIPEEIKARSRATYGLLPESIAGIYSNREQPSGLQNPAETRGFGFFQGVNPPMEPIAHVYFSTLRKTLNLLKSKAATGSEDTRQHYRLLIFKIEQALK